MQILKQRVTSLLSRVSNQPRVIIVGSGLITGGVKEKPSDSRKVLRELITACCYDIGITLPRTLDLTPWESKGILVMDLEDMFTTYALSYLGRKYPEAVFVLLGKAGIYEALVSQHTVHPALVYDHPTHRGGARFREAMMFSSVSHLAKLTKDDWRLDG